MEIDLLYGEPPLTMRSIFLPELFNRQSMAGLLKMMIVLVIVDLKDMSRSVVIWSDLKSLRHFKAEDGMGFEPLFSIQGYRLESKNHIFVLKIMIRKIFRHEFDKFIIIKDR